MASEGLLRDVLKSTPLAGLGVTPQFSQNEIVVELTEAQLKDMLLSGADSNIKARAQGSMTVKLTEGKLILKIRLW